MSSDKANDALTVTYFDSRDQARELALSLVQRATRQVCFFGSSLDNVLFDNMAFIAALSEFCRQSSRTTAKFVVHDTKLNTSHGHRILPLAQQLTSSLFIRTSSQQHHNLNQYFMIVDDNAYLYGQNNTRYEGRSHFDDKAETRQFQRLFDAIWDHSHPDVHARRLYI